MCVLASALVMTDDVPIQEVATFAASGLYLPHNPMPGAGGAAVSTSTSRLPPWRSPFVARDLRHWLGVHLRARHCVPVLDPMTGEEEEEKNEKKRQESHRKEEKEESKVVGHLVDAVGVVETEGGSSASAPIVYRFGGLGARVLCDNCVIQTCSSSNCD